MEQHSTYLTPIFQVHYVAYRQTFNSTVPSAWDYVCMKNVIYTLFDFYPFFRLFSVA